MRFPTSDLLKENRSVLVLCVATMLLTAGQGIANPVLPLYARDLGVSGAEIGLVVSAFGLARFMTNIPAGILSDRAGRRLLLVGGPLVAAVGNLISATANSLGPLLAYRFVAGVGSAAFITGAVIFIADVATLTNRGRLMGLYQGSFLLGIALGPALGGLVAELFGLRAPFIVVGLLSLASGAWALLRVPESRRLAREKRDVLSEGAVQQKAPDAASRGTYSFLFSRDYLLIALVFAGTFFTRGGTQLTLLPLKAANDLHLSPGQIGGLFTALAALNLVAILISGTLADRYGRKWVIVPGLLLFAVCLVVLGESATVLVFTVGMLLYGFAQGLDGATPPAYVADISPPGRQALGQSVSRSIGDLAIVVAPPLMGLAADAVGTAIAFWGNALFMAALGLLFLTAREPLHAAPRRRQAAQHPQREGSRGS
ncbi:MAG: MFS transporter [Chloroflexi bacterium]|nr:MFS transporter [Chloroflexota bacterium]